MKTYLFCRKLILGFLLILGGSLNALSQDESMVLHPLIPKPGYIISNTGDTIYGKIKSGTKLTDRYISQIILIGPNKEKIRYDAGSILKLGVETIIHDDLFNPIYSYWDFFECRPSPKSAKMVFMWRFESGRIKVFNNPRSMTYKSEWSQSGPEITGISFTYSPDEGLSIWPTSNVTTYIKIWHSSYYIEKDGGELIEINKKNYESLWPMLLGDCPGIIEEVNKNPDLKKFNNFLLIVRLYNQLCN